MTAKWTEEPGEVPRRPTPDELASEWLPGVRVTADLRARLDDEVARRGGTRGELIRDAIERHLDRCELDRDLVAFVHPRVDRLLPDIEHYGG